MFNKFYSTMEKNRVVLLPLCFLLLVCLIFSGFIGVRQVFAETDDVSEFNYTIKNGDRFDYYCEDNHDDVSSFNKYTNNSLHAVYSFFPSYNYEFSSFVGNSLTIYSFLVNRCSGSVSEYSNSDFEFLITLDKPLTFSYVEDCHNSLEWCVKDNSFFNTYFCLPTHIGGIISGLDEPLSFNESLPFYCDLNTDMGVMGGPFQISPAYLLNSVEWSVYWSALNNVTFLDRDGSTIISSSSVISGDYAIIPDAPDYEGYDFIGWLPSISGVGVSEPITQDITFTATYSIKRCSITIEDYDGTILNSFIVDYGCLFSTDIVPDRVGYSFSGYSSKSGYILGEPVCSDVVLVATYQINKYIVTFSDYNGDIISSDVVEYGTRVVTPSDPSLVGHSFIGWSCSKNGYGIDSVVDCDLEFIANYSLNSYIVNFYDFDNTLLNSVNVSFGYSINSRDIPNVSRIGYSFDSWSSSIDGFLTTDIVYCNVDFTAEYGIILEFWDGYEYAKDENYNNGFNDGVSSAKDSFYSGGYNDGYLSGYNDGYGVGESAGLSSKDTFKSLIYSIIDAPFNVLSNAFNFDIFGVNVSYFLISIVSLLLVAVVIKKLI